jgi:hypothetical protein
MRRPVTRKRAPSFESASSGSQLKLPEELLWQEPHVRANGALPLYVGWTEIVGIRPDGELVRWSSEDWPGAFELNDATWHKVALVLGARRYPVLQRLIPERPEGARDCHLCQGSGRLPLQPEILCQCGGIGWLDAD